MNETKPQSAGCVALGVMLLFFGFVVAYSMAGCGKAKIPQAFFDDFEKYKAVKQINPAGDGLQSLDVSDDGDHVNATIGKAWYTLDSSEKRSIAQLFRRDLTLLREKHGLKTDFVAATVWDASGGKLAEASPAGAKSYD